MSDPHATLLVRIAAGQEAALAELHRGMARKVFGFAMRHLDDADAANAVVCDTFFSVWLTAASFTGASLASTWILGIARHKALDEVRRRARLVSLDESAEPADEDAPLPCERLARDEQRQRVRACIGLLPVKQRECVHLVFFEELGLAEIAAIQGVPENTVKTRLYHARRKLRAMLVNEEIAHDASGLAA
jgi:RNA polymerase sigma-70 factor (ECF subfamily)